MLQIRKNKIRIMIKEKILFCILFVYIISYILNVLYIFYSYIYKCSDDHKLLTQ